MPKIIGIVGLVAINICVIVCLIRCYKKKNTMGRRLARTLMFSLFILWAYAGNFLTQKPGSMAFLACAEHALIVWAFYFWMTYVFALVKVKLNRTVEKISLTALVLDSVMLLTNPVNHFLSEFSINGNEEVCYAVLEPKGFYIYHLTLGALFVMTMVILIIRKAVSCPKYYRWSYLIVLVFVVAIVGFYVLYEIQNTYIFDYSRTLYGIGAFLVFEATYNFTPTVLLRKLQKYIDDNITDATILYDNDGTLLKANDRALKLFTEEELSSPDELCKKLGNLSKEGISIEKVGDFDYEVIYKKIYDEGHMHIATSFILHDITNSKRQLDRERKIACMDTLTNSLNRRGFMELAPQFLKENAENGGYAIMVSGIYNFKGINGLYGTQAGDRVLKEIARLLHDHHHEFPMLYGRTAEGKFTCILPFEHVDEIVDKTTRITVKIEENAEIKVDMYHGFVVIKDMNMPIDYYYELALLALARCKEKMTSPVLEYSKDLAEEQRKRQLILEEMHGSIEKREFFIELQPQIDLKKNTISGAEALVRWNHPVLGRIYPEMFVSLFENNGFITYVDQFIWNEAAGLLKRFEESGVYDGSISVNVSQVDVMCMDVCEAFKEIVERNGIEPSKLHVEITESACVNNREVLVNTMNKLRENGFLVEIDDFGSGYSSLNALMKLPFDIVKLDMDFMRQDTRDDKCEAIMSAITGMIHDVGAKVISEGVETIENAESAVYFNCDSAQGYHYSKPLSIEKFLKFIKEYHN